MERELVERAMHGDEEAFDTLVGRIGDSLHSVARRILRDTTLAQDATQQALLDAWRYLPQFDVPEGWFSWISNADVAGLIVDNGVGDGGSGWGTTFWIVDNVYADPCDPESQLDPPLGPSVDDLVTALASLPGYEATAPVDITNSGFAGVEFELTAPDYGEECPQHRTWSTASSEPRVMLPGETNRLRILDVDGVRLVQIMTEYAHTTEYEQALGIPFDANAHAADQPELREILDSIRIEGRP